MSFEERSTWTYAVIAVVVPAVYFAAVLAQLRDTEAAQVAYVRPLLVAIGLAIVLNVVAHIVTAMLWPRDADLKDERDKEINRFGEYVGFYVISIGVLIPFGLAMAEIDQFWIANAIYLAFVLSALASSGVKIVAYRRGF
jgi:hypothetical protein